MKKTIVPLLTLLFVIMTQTTIFAYDNVSEVMIDPIYLDNEGKIEEPITLKDGGIITRTAPGEVGAISAYGSEAEFNIEDGNGTVSIQLKTGSGVDSYGNYNSLNKGSNIKINGNLLIEIKGMIMPENYGAAQAYGLSAMYGASSVELNGNSKIYVEAQSSASNKSYASGVLSQGEKVKVTVNGKIDISALSKGMGSTYASGAEAVEGGSIYFNDAVNIHNVNSYREMTPENEMLKGLAYAAGAVANGTESSIIFNGDTVINSINGECEDPASKDITEVSIAAEDGGRVIVNEGKNNLVQIEGDVVANGEGSTVVLNLNTSDSYIEGEVLALANGNIDLSLSNSATWKVRGSEIDSIISDDGIISMFYNRDLDDTFDEQYDELTINLLRGNGATFVMNSDLNNNRGDMVTIEQVDGENHSYVQFYDTEYISAGEGHEYIFAYIPEEGMEISGKQTDIGIYKYDPVLREEMVGDTKQVYLTGFEKTGEEQESGSVLTIKNTALATRGMWRSHDSSLSKRITSLNLNRESGMDIWVKSNVALQELNVEIEQERTRKVNTQDTSTEQHLMTVQGGVDGKWRKEGYDWHVGADLSYSRGKVDLDPGKINTDGISVSVYGTWMYDNGHYLDLVAKGSKLSSQFQTYINTNQETKADYGNFGMALSTEYGYKSDPNDKGYYSGYQTQAVIGYVTGTEYTTDMNVNVVVHPTANLTLKAAGIFGRKITSGTNMIDIYGKLGIGHEFLEKTVMSLKDTQQEEKQVEQDLRGTWCEYGMGITGKIGSHTNYYVEVDKTSFGKINVIWRANAGIKLEW